MYETVNYSGNLKICLFQTVQSSWLTWVGEPMPWTCVHRRRRRRRRHPLTLGGTNRNRWTYCNETWHGHVIWWHDLAYQKLSFCNF